MTCATCESAPVRPADKQGPHHVATRFDDNGLGLVVLWRGNDVTARCVEAVAGPPGQGWVEMMLCDSDGTPIIHAAAPRCCPECGAERAAGESDADGCADCGSVEPTVQAWQAHVATSVRHGHVAILRGRELITAPASDAAPSGPVAVDANEQARGMAAVFLAEHPHLVAEQEAAGR